MAQKKTADTDSAARIEAAMAAGAETVEKTMNAAREAMETMSLDKTVGMARAQAEAARKTVFGGCEQFAEANKAGMEAYAASLDAMADGAEAFGKEIADFAARSMAATAENGRNMMACKTVNEAVALQTEMARTGFDSLVMESAKLAEISLKTANEAMAPIAERANRAFDGAFGKPSA